MAATVEDATDLIVDDALAEEKLLEELERLEVPADIREARLETLKREAAEFATMHEKQHGQYTEIMTEKEFFRPDDVRRAMCCSLLSYGLPPL